MALTKRYIKKKIYNLWCKHKNQELNHAHTQKKKDKTFIVSRSGESCTDHPSYIYNTSSSDESVIMA